MKSGFFIIVDGIDGSGKSSILNAWAEGLEQAGKKVFHLKEYWKTHGRHPELTDLAAYDVIISAEPTSVWVGAAIREELIRDSASYDTKTIAEAYALDRFILYQRLIVPLREQGKIILQDRGVSTSLCYQSVQDNPLPMKEIVTIPGNAYALEHAPDHLVIADVPIQIALSRLASRHDKQDQSFFERGEFLERARDCFLSAEYQDCFSTRSTGVHILNADQHLAIMKQNAIDFLSTIAPDLIHSSSIH